MSSIYLLPSAAGTYQEWTVGAGSRPSCVQTNDGDTTYIEEDVTGRDSYQLDDMPAAAVINSVQGKAVHRRTAAGSGTQRIGTRYSGTDQYSGGITSDLSYTESSYTFPNKPGGGTWTEAVLNATEIIFQRQVDGAATIYCTQMRLYVDYTPPAGGFAFLIVSLIGTLLGAGVVLADMPGIAKAAREASGSQIVRIRPQEYEVALAELRAHPFRSFFLPEIG